MRAVTFTLGERLVLIPVEIALIWKIFALITLVIFILSGIGPGLYSITSALNRGMTATGATAIAILAGAAITPALLPWIPGRQFWWKGLFTGGLAGAAYIFVMMAHNMLLPFDAAGLLLWIMAAASYMAMNFTGATPFTSLSGVEKEMRYGLPVQCAGACVALILWLASPFIG
jgi:hypothetical protein